MHAAAPDPVPERAVKDVQAQQRGHSSHRVCWRRQNPKSHVHKVIGVVSGKGGVGKSMVTASLANQMAAQGYKVGILDADITGPSIPKMYGVHGPAEMDGDFIKPVMTANGIKVMSINLLLPDEESPVIWRGPILANMDKTVLE